MDDRNVQLERWDAADTQELCGLGLGDGTGTCSGVGHGEPQRRTVPAGRAPQLRGELLDRAEFALDGRGDQRPHRTRAPM